MLWCTVTEGSIHRQRRLSADYRRCPHFLPVRTYGSRTCPSTLCIILKLSASQGESPVKAILTCTLLLTGVCTLPAVAANQVKLDPQLHGTIFSKSLPASINAVV